MSARLFPALVSALLVALTGCASGSIPGATDSFAGGSDLLAPGDRIEIIVHTAPELSGEQVVAPDGLVQVPLAGPVMAMARTPEELAVSLEAALASELIDPDVQVVTIGFASPKVFVDGEVRLPGVYDLPDQMEAAIAMAGGLKPDASAGNTLLIRRFPGGEVKALPAGDRPLRRFDVLYVSRDPVTEPDAFVRQYVREALPLPFRLYFDVGE